MALSALPAVLCRALRDGGPLLLAALLTLLLGWSAWQDAHAATRSCAATPTVQPGAPQPAGDLPDLHALAPAEADPSTEHAGAVPVPVERCPHHLARRLSRLHSRPSSALTFRPAPLRQPPGRAPPLA